MDRYESLRSLPFPVVIEALGFSAKDFKSRKSGMEYAGKCPVHQPRRNSTSFSYSSDGKWNCFSCSAHGRGCLDLVMAVRNCGFQAAVEFLEPLSASKIVAEASKIQKPPQVRTIAELPPENEAKRFTYEKYRVDSPWLAARGLKPETLDSYGVFQYSNPARKSAYQNKVMIRLQRFSDGQVTGYLVRDPRPAEERGDSPKYLLPPDYFKQLDLWGAWQLKEQAPIRVLYVVESAFSVMHFHQLNFPCVALLGWSVSEKQAEIIGQIAKGVVALPDRDKYREFAPSGYMLSQRMWCKTPPMPEGVDDPERLTLDQIKSLT